MAQVQELIDKIKTEGVQEAKSKASEIESQAQAKAEKIVEDAMNEAKSIIAQANEEAQKTKEATTKSLQQSARNMLLSLRKEIESLLNNVIADEVKATLKENELASIIDSAITTYLKESKTDGAVVITVSESDAKKLKTTLLAKLQKKIKSGVTLKSSGDLTAGFSASFDDGKSSFDFTDQSLVDFLSSYLNEEMGKILKTA